MSAPSQFDGIKHVVSLSTNISQSCKHCEMGVGGDDDSLAGDINHYINSHGYRLLHVGTETTHADEGLWHSTVALLGHDNPPPLNEVGELDEFVG